MELSIFEDKIKEILSYCRSYGTHTLVKRAALTADSDRGELNRLCFDRF